MLFRSVPTDGVIAIPTDGVIAVPTDGAAGGPGGVTGERSGGPDVAGGATATTSTGAVPDGA